MATYEVKIRITSESVEETQRIANLIQNTINVVNNQDLEKLLSKVRSNPNIVKTALKFI
ncbi:MAG: hypothetical protein J6V35_03235 [Bacteroidales bacterium]|nr:hypothetical protein [Bacteroidales bacterium]